MNILLINTSPVVSRLISIFVNEKTFLDEPKNISQLKFNKYDLVFVDDESYISEIEQLLKNTPFIRKVLLSSKKMPDDIVNCFDEVIQKPFLPSQIRDAIDTTSRYIKDNHIQSTTVQSANILDKDEISKIKELLEDSEGSEDFSIDKDNYESRKVEAITKHLESDGLEIVIEDEIANILSEKAIKEKKRKKKSSKKDAIFEEKLLLAIERMGTKKLKKLLKGAEINISIKFKDDK